MRTIIRLITFLAMVVLILEDDTIRTGYYIQLNRANSVFSKMALNESNLTESSRLYLLKKLDDSINDLERYSDCSADWENIHARIKFELGEYVSAISLLNNKLERCGNSTLSLFLVGKNYLAMGSVNKTIEAWEQAGLLTEVQILGDRMADLGRWIDAIQAYEAVIELSPNDCVYRIRLGNAFWRGEKNATRALTSYELARQQCPENLEVYVETSRVLIDIQQYELAKQYAVQARNVVPTSELPLNIMALSCLRQDRPFEALSLLKESSLLNPSNDETHALIGSAYLAISLYEEAIQELQQAIMINSSQGWYFANLGLAYEQHGMHTEAIAAYRRALEVDPNQEWVGDRLQRIQDK